MSSKLASLTATPLKLQLTHLLLSCIWNLASVYLISQNKPALGPTASISTSLILLALIFSMVIGIRKYHRLYFIATIIAMSGASIAIYGALTGDSGLWPSPFWRYAGVCINSLGLIGGALGIYRLYYYSTSH